MEGRQTRLIMPRKAERELHQTAASSKPDDLKKFTYDYSVRKRSANECMLVWQKLNRDISMEICSLGGLLAKQN